MSNPNESKSLSYFESMLRVCVDRLEPEGVAGRVYSMRLIRPVPFADLHELILEMEAVMDAQNHPQAFQRIRVFGTERTPAAAAVEDADVPMTQEEVDAAQGGVSTFMIQVISRQHASWQGFIDWLDGGKQSFESELELAELIDKKLRPEAGGLAFS